MLIVVSPAKTLITNRHCDAKVYPTELVDYSKQLIDVCRRLTPPMLLH